VKNQERAHLFVAANTHPGMKGKNNEDRYAISTHRLGSKKDIPSVLAVVCDGIGGHRAGEVAAEIAVETVSKVVAQSDGTQPLETLKQAIHQASAAVQAQAEANPERRGMGATCVCAWVIGDRLYTTSVGDSRLYLIRDDKIQQLTTDHTWIQEAIDYGALTPEQARGHPNAHVIRRYLGSQVLAEPDFRLRLHPEDTDEQAEANQGLRIQPGDFLVLTSDGLTDLVEKEEILSILKDQEREPALQALTDLANERGGHDNITIVTLEAPEALATFAQPVAQTPGGVLSSRRLALPCLVIALLLMVLAAAAAGAVWAFGGPLRQRTPTVTASPTTLLELSPTPETPLVAPPETLPESTSTPSAQPEATATLTAGTESGAGPQKATYTPWPTNTPPPSVTATATESPQPTPTGTQVRE
jgi:protein phosphatase